MSEFNEIFGQAFSSSTVELSEWLEDVRAGPAPRSPSPSFAYPHFNFGTPTFMHQGQNFKYDYGLPVQEGGISQLNEYSTVSPALDLINACGILLIVLYSKDQTTMCALCAQLHPSDVSCSDTLSTVSTGSSLTDGGYSPSQESWEAEREESQNSALTCVQSYEHGQYHVPSHCITVAHSSSMRPGQQGFTGCGILPPPSPPLPLHGIETQPDSIPLLMQQATNTHQIPLDPILAASDAAIRTPQSVSLYLEGGTSYGAHDLAGSDPITQHASSSRFPNVDEGLSTVDSLEVVQASRPDWRARASLRRAPFAAHPLREDSTSHIGPKRVPRRQNARLQRPETPYLSTKNNCHICKQGFNRLPDLKRHKDTLRHLYNEQLASQSEAQGDLGRSSESSESSAPTPKPTFQCGGCGSVLCRKDALRRHQKKCRAVNRGDEGKTQNQANRVALK